MIQFLIPMILGGALWVGVAFVMAVLPRPVRAPANPSDDGSRPRGWTRRFKHYLTHLVVLLPAGYLGGVVLGFVILAFGGLAGRSGTTGTEFFGYWNPTSLLFFSGLYGSLIGTVVAPAGYFLFLQEMPPGSLRRAVLLSSAGTLLGGLSGALVSPPVAAVTGCIGFLAGCKAASIRMHAKEG